MASVGTLAMNLTANSAGFTQGLNQAARSVQALKSQVSGFAGSFANQLTGALGGIGAAGFLGWGVKLASDAETAQASFSVLTGSADQARQMLAEIKALSQGTGVLSQGMLRDASVTLLQFGVAADSILPRLRQIGDISGGDAQKFQSLALAFAQMNAAGRLMGQEVLQLVNAGFNPLQEISRKTGESMAELKARMEAGGISSREVGEAFDTATAAGGRFFGMLDSRAGTSAGQFARLRASTEDLARGLGESLLPAAVSVMEAVTPMVTAFAALDEKTRSTVVQVGLWAAGTVALIVVGAQLVRSIQTIVSVLRSMAVAQAVVQSLSGPKGWAALVGAAAAAAGAFMLINEAFAGAQNNIDEAVKAADRTAAKAQKSLDAGKKAADAAAKANAESQRTIDAAAAVNSAKAAEQTRMLEELGRRGRELTEQFRSPAEVLRDSAAELHQLFALGAINGVTFNRAMRDAHQQAASARGEMERIEQMRRGIGAAVAGTSGGFSAIQEALRNADAERARFVAEQRMAREAGAGRVPEQQLAEQKKANELLQAMQRSLVQERFEPAEIKFLVANF